MLVRPALREYRTWTLDSRYWKGYAPRQDDIIIATAPKCGTTWMQQIVSSLVFQDAQIRALPAVSPWVEARFHYTNEEMRANLAAIPHRRFLKSHLPIDGLPIHDEVKYIHVARDGRDMALSMHNHSTGLRQGADCPVRFHRLRGPGHRKALREASARPSQLLPSLDRH
jgi:aryl sulfotransferase